MEKSGRIETKDGFTLTLEKGQLKDVAGTGRQLFLPEGIERIRTGALSELKTLSPNVILWAAEYATPLDHASRLSAQYSDLYAIHLSSSKLLLPWYRETDPQTHAFEIDKNYPFPDYIRDILDDNYEVDPKKLHTKLEELKPYVNV